MQKSPLFKQALTLVPVNLWDQSEIEELTEQRKICGWCYELSELEKWRDQIERGVKLMWWIVVSDQKSTSTTDIHNNADNARSKRAGHISMASETSPPDPDLARSDRSIMTVGSFFILPEYRAGGLGRASWEAVEERVRRIPECKQIAIDTWDRRYALDESDEWGGMLKQVGIVIPRTLINEDWYARMGYTKFKNVPRYPIPGHDKLMVSSYLRKDLK